MEKLDLLVFAAHPDDAEMSCGGVILQAVKQGKKVGIIDLTQGELGTRGTEITRAEEAANASKILGITVRENLKMRDGFFKNDEEHQLKIVECIRKYQPNMILANALFDRHPDHGRAARLVADAVFLSGLRKIDTNQIAWRPSAVLHYIQDRTLKPDVLVDISDYMQAKMEAIKAYKTQFYDPNSTEPASYLTTPEFLNILEGRCADWGKQIGVRYAEGFQIERSIGVRSVFDVI